MKKFIEDLKNMDPKERNKKIWILVGFVFIVLVILGYVFK